MDNENMNYSIEFDAENDFFLIRTEGAFDIAVFCRLADELLSHSAWSPGKDCLFDYRKTDFVDSALEDLKTASNLHKSKNDLVGPGRSALVMTDITNFGMGRMYQGLTEPSVATRFRVFTDFAEAQSWIAIGA